MRVLFAVTPGLGHVLPTVPLLWALRAAGHEVLVTSAGEGVDAAKRAGLPVVDTAPGLDIFALFGQGRLSAEEMAEMVRANSEEFVRTKRNPDVVLELYAKLTDIMADETLRVARHWQPDLVVYTDVQGAGLLAACALGVPAVEHGYTLVQEGGFAARYLPFLGATSTRLGIPERLGEIRVVHVAPPGFLVGADVGWHLRYVPYNGGGVLPESLWRPADRPRVLVTLGTVMPTLSGFGGLKPLLAAAAEVDAEFLLAFGDSVDVDDLGVLPANAHPIGWVPLYPLLTGCAAVVHHGGSGTTLTALATGVPQLVLPHAVEQFVNADVVAEHGVGLRREPDDVDSATLTTLLADDALRTTARAAADQVRAQPTPASLVPRLEDLARTTAAAPVSARG
jgi:UDP:flavonoid glycosyltransferase YjiC (YdhE family)